ncbi:MAG: hypothetical protein KC645_09015, partial [Gemmatimonadetes bacterium]|nr:hypothetical protein [Gemmatimonadota bacterium]
MIRKSLPLVLASLMLSGCMTGRSEGYDFLGASLLFGLLSESAVTRDVRADPAGPPLPLPLLPEGTVLNPAVSVSIGGMQGTRVLDGSASLLFPLPVEGDLVPYAGGGPGLRRFTRDGADARNNPYLGLKAGVRYDGLGRVRPAVEAGYGVGSEWNFSFLSAMLQV